jgi:hypothetical protein
MTTTNAVFWVALVRTDVSEEINASIIRMKRIGELGTTNRHTLRLLVKAKFVPSSQILVTLMMEWLNSSETMILTRATLHNIPEGGILITLFSLNSVKISCSDNQFR